METKGLSRVFSNVSSKALVLQCSAFFIVQLSHPYVTTGKTIALTRWAFVENVMSVSLSKYESEKTEAQRGKELKVLLIEESCFNLISLIPKLNFPHMGYAMV